MQSSPFTQAGRDIHDLASQIRQKADSHEVSSLRSHVDRLEHSLRESRSEVDGLRDRMQSMEARLEGLERRAEESQL
jgi:septal ring factor EnvC (AmiA/AmiB activator)